MQQTPITLTPFDGGPALVLPAGQLEQDALGNLTVRWTDALHQGHLLTAYDLAGYLSTAVDVHRNRDGAIVAITDPGGRLLEIEWSEYDPWTGTPAGPFTFRCVGASAGSTSDSGEARLSVVFYRTHYRYERVTGVLEGS